MEVSKEIEIDLAHRVQNHKSKCRTPHGHRYKIRVTVDDKVVTEKGTSDEGMVIDFSDLKQTMMEVIDGPYDHSGVFSYEDPKISAIKDFYEGSMKQPIFVPFIPTAENLAQHWYFLMKDALLEKGIKIKNVIVWETPTSTAMYEETN